MMRAYSCAEFTEDFLVMQNMRPLLFIICTNNDILLMF